MSRAELAQQQAALVESLVGRAEAPPGFDAERLQTAGESLATKRRKEVAHVWPGLTRSLGDRYSTLFAEFAEQTPLPKVGGPRADGRAFAHYLAKLRLLPDEGRLEALRVDVYFKMTRDGLTHRRGTTVLMARLRDSRRLVLALRLPLLGERWLTIRYR